MKTYSTSTCLKVNDKNRANKLCDLPQRMLEEATEGVEHVNYDEVRVLPSVEAIYVGMLVHADSAQQAAERAEKCMKVLST